MGNEWMSAGRGAPRLRDEEPLLHDDGLPHDSQLVHNDERRRPSLPGRRFLAGIDPLVAELETRLRAMESPLVADPGVRDDYLRKVSTILTECAVHLCDDDGNTAPVTQLKPPDSGALIAAQGLQLAELIRAFDVFTELATRLVHSCVVGWPDGLQLMSGAMLTLNQSVAARVQEAALSYDHFLADRIAQAQAGVRRRLAREVHDHVGNGLSLAHRHLEMYEVLRGRDGVTVHPKVAEARGALTETLENIRRLVSGLRLEQPGIRIVEAVERFVASMDPGPEVDVRLDGDERWIPEGAANELYTVIRETLRNAFAHARATRLTVRLVVRPGETRISVLDDGIGFDTTALYHGHGLASMAERVHALDGSLDIWSRPGMGTCVQAWVPLVNYTVDGAGSAEEIRIMVADDHTLLREAVCDMLRLEEGFQVVGEAADGDSAVDTAKRLQPDVLLLDVGMPGSQPGLTVRRLKEVAPDTAIIIVSMFTEQRLIQELLNRGVRGYLDKSVSRQELASAIRGVRRRDRGQVVISTALEELRQSADGSPLSAREHEILVLVADAMSNRQIAGRLEITEGTVKRHLRNIFGKLGAVSRIDAVNKAVADGLIDSRSATRPHG